MSAGVISAGSVFVASLGVLTSALAGPPGSQGSKPDWQIAIGGGGLYSPDYEGSDDYEFRALPYVRVAYQDWATFSVPEGLKVSLVSSDGFRAGALVGYRFEREASDNLALAGWGDVDGSVEVGGFVEYRVDALRFGLEARHGLSDDTGTLATLSMRYQTRLGPLMVSAGPEVTWASDDYMQTYFGITPAQAATAVLAYAPYAAEAGIKHYGLGATLVMPIDDNWSVTGLFSVKRLTGDAADSPIVRLQGDETQFMAGIFVGYTF